MPVSASAQTLAEIKTALAASQAALTTAIETRASKDVVAKLQRQVDAMDVSLAHRIIADSGGGTPLLETLKANEDVQRLMRDRRGSAVITLTGKDAAAFMSRKAIISGSTSGSSEGDPLTPVGIASTGVLMLDRIAGITTEARQQLTVRDALFARPTTMAAIDYVKVTSPMGVASPAPEASTMAENSVQFTSFSEKVKTIATWIPATKQVLDDFVELMGFIQTSIPYYIGLEEEIQLLGGDDIGEDLHGLIPQSMVFDPTLLSATAGWNRIDVVGRAIEQIVTAKELTPTFCILHPADWWSIRLSKDGLGRYLIGDPQSSARASLFDLQVIPTTSMVPGSFLLGSGNPTAAEIRDRSEIIVEISTQHADYFVRGLVAVRGERRLALVCKRPNSFVSGSFTTSPA